LNTPIFDHRENKKHIDIGITHLDTNKAVVGAVREPPLRLISIDYCPNCVTPIDDWKNFVFEVGNI
jgi:hypothetical protein